MRLSQRKSGSRRNRPQIPIVLEKETDRKEHGWMNEDGLMTKEQMDVTFGKEDNGGRE